MLSIDRLTAMVAMLLMVLPGSVGTADDDDDPNGAATRPVVHGSIEVTAEAIEIPTATIVGREAIRSITPLGDGSEVLRDVSGVDLGRMGGHGLEPFVRGLSQGDLTVLLDGAKVHGGCPNRMDPSTSYAVTETTDSVVVIRGVQTMRYGPGAPGGTVIYDRVAPIFDETTWDAEVTTGGSSWSNDPDLAFDAAIGFGDWSLRALGSSRNTDNYEDGDGAEVRSGAESRSATLMGGWRPDEFTMLELSYERSQTDDALFAGAGMDSPETITDLLRFQSERETTDGRLGWRVDVFANQVDHLMDNYSLRELSAPVAMRALSETSTRGLRGHIDLGRLAPLIAGVTVESANADATLFAGPNPLMMSVVQSILWPEVTNTQFGVFVEGSTAIGSATRLVYGARVDRFSSDAGRADEATVGGSGPTPRQLWRSYTGNDDDEWSSTEFGGLVRVQYTTGAWQLYGGLSRTARVADATERFLGANSSMAPMRWIGNPGLAPAISHQLDLGAGWSTGDAALGLALFAADVDDSILRDRAHGQPDILQNDNATVYRNVDARRYGAEADISIRFAAPLMLNGSLAWVWAQNITDDRPVGQTPPLHGNLGVGWSHRSWAGGGVVRFAAEQDRVDDDRMTGSGLDAGPTPGWAVLDLYGSIDIESGFGIQAGIANVFDGTYANHLNRESLFDPEPVRVNEPGRTYWLRVRWRGGG